MKVIKRTTCNTMSDARLSDLCISAVERDLNTDVEQLMVDVTNSHGNSSNLIRGKSCNFSKIFLD